MAGIRYANTPLLAAGLPSKIDLLTSLDIGKGILRGISQIYLLDNLISAGLIIFGMVIGSRVLTLWALLGSVTGTLTALALGVSKGNILAGLWQYNAVLSCMAIGGVFFLFSNRVLILAILCGILCTLLTGTLAGLFPEGVPVATLPFCLGTTVFIIAMNNLPKIKTFLEKEAES
jgi:urea transporter